MIDRQWAEPELRNDERWLIAALVATVVFAAVALGAVQAWSEQVVLCGAILAAGIAGWRALAICRARGAPGAVARLPPWWLLAPVGLFLLLVLFQLLPLPGGMVGVASPEAMRLRRDLLDDIPGIDRKLAVSTVSLYTESGWRQLRMLLAVVAVFVAAAAIGASRAARLLLMSGLTAVGLSVALIAMGHQALGVPAIWGAFPPPMPPTRSAPFINHGHFAQFMNLSLGFALATALTAAHAFRAELRPRGIAEWLDAARQGQLNRLLFATVSAGVIVVALTLSGSRGGLIAMVVAIVAGATVSIRRGRSGGSRSAMAMVAAALLGVTGVAWLASDHMHRRITALGDDASAGDRLLILRSLPAVWKAFPLTGTGLGTFEFVYPMYDRTKPINLTTHAENEYAHLLTETGAPGLALAAWFVVGIGWCAARCLRRGVYSAQAATGILVGIVAVLVHSLTDFGQHVPANAMLTAIGTGLIAGMCRRKASDDVSRGVAASGWPAAALPAMLAVAMLLLLPAADQARRAESAARSARPLVDELRAAGWAADDDAFYAALAPLTRAVELRPGEVRARFELNVLRYYSLARNPEGVLPVESAEASGAADGASPTTIAAGPAVALEPGAAERAARAAERIAAEFDAIRLLCPTFGEPYSMAGQIRRALGREEAGRALLAKAMRLSTYDGVTILFNAEEAMARGDVQTAKRLFDNASALLAIGRETVIRRFAGEYARPDDALEMAGDDRSLLRVAAEALRQAGHAAQADEAQRRGDASLRRTAEDPTAPAGVMFERSRLAQREGNTAEAVQYLRRAVFRQPDRADWRLELARLLADTGDLPSAIDEVDAALRTRPNDRAAAALRDELLRRRQP